VLLREDGHLVGFAVRHYGPGTEAGNQKCYVKFGAVQPGPTAAAQFDRLLAAARGLSHLETGMNLARHEAYRKMIERGFRTDFQGVTMHRPNEPGYSRFESRPPNPAIAPMEDATSGGSSHNRPSGKADRH
jgi:hypothetical protein